MTIQKSSSSIKIDVDTVRHIAFLVRLGISETEVQVFSQQFTSIIDYFHLLNQVDTLDVPPANQYSNIQTVMRADEVRPSMPREDFLKNVPHRNGNFVQVPHVFDEE